VSASRVARLALTHLVGAAALVGLVVSVAIAPSASPAQAIGGVVMPLATLGTGWLLAVKVPRNAVGWALIVITSVFASGAVAVLIGEGIRAASPGAAAGLLWFSGDGAAYFPDGRSPSRRWRWFSWLTGGEITFSVFVFATSIGPSHGTPNPVLIPAVAAVRSPLYTVAALLAVLCFAGTVVSLVARYRHGGAALRAQLRWMLWSVAMSTAFLATDWLVPNNDLANAFGLVLFCLIPVSIAVAVLRYRLYEIDRIISRTAAYAIVTVVVVGTYALVVLLASSVVPDSVGVAVGTLAAAAVFLPVLRRARRGVDRVFNRTQYDAERVVEAFGEQIRNGGNPSTAGRQLLDAVEESLDPSAVGLWVRP
jgi:hypothetical protein